jgi:hypothetical protein
MRGVVRSVSVLLVGAMTGVLVVPQPTSAVRMEPVAVSDVMLTVSNTEARQLPIGKLALGVAAAGTGVVDCLDNTACHDRGLHETVVPISQAATMVINPRTGRGSGRIVIDVIGAGFKGSVRTEAAPTGDGMWDVGLSIRAQARNGDQLTSELAGELNRADGIIGILVGLVIISSGELG